MLSNFFDIERFIHSIKTAIACLIGLLVSKIIGLSGGQWIVITIIVVMCAQIYVGSVIQKAYFRFLGTLVGCLLATFTIVMVGNSLLTIALAMCLYSFIFSYIATSQENLTYAGTLGAVTTAIILLGQTPTVFYAAERFLEISIGILIAALTSQFVLPIHARTHLRRTQAKTLEQLRLLYIACMVTRPIEDENFSYEELDESIIKLLTKQRQLAKESAREPLGESFDPKIFLQSLHAEKEILRAIDYMNSSLAHMQNIENILIQSTSLKKFNDDIVNALNVIIKSIQADNRKDEHIHIPTLAQLKQDFASHLSLPRPEEWIYLDGFLFSAESLIENLTKLATLYKIPVYESSTPPLQIT